MLDQEQISTYWNKCHIIVDVIKDSPTILKAHLENSVLVSSKNYAYKLTLLKPPKSVQMQQNTLNTMAKPCYNKTYLFKLDDDDPGFDFASTTCFTILFCQESNNFNTFEKRLLNEHEYLSSLIQLTFIHRFSIYRHIKSILAIFRNIQNQSDKSWAECELLTITYNLSVVQL